MFTDAQRIEKDREAQRAVIKIKNRYGGDAVLRGISYMEGATAKIRSHQIGGHRK